MQIFSAGKKRVLLCVEYFPDPHLMHATLSSFLPSPTIAVLKQKSTTLCCTKAKNGSTTTEQKEPAELRGNLAGDLETKELYYCSIVTTFFPRWVKNVQFFLQHFENINVAKK